MKISELIGVELDAAVADADGVYWFAGDGQVILTHGSSGPGSVQRYSPSTDWSQGGPIIERERITLETWGMKWHAVYGYIEMIGDTPLIAAMRAFAASKK